MEASSLPENLKRLRAEKRLSQAELSRQAEVSPGYVSELEGGQGKRPGGQVLMRLAKVLGVTIAELLGESARPGASALEPDPSLLEFAKERNLPPSDVEMLAGVRFRGDPPRTSRRWAMIYDTIVSSQMLDDLEEG
ncbi:MAG: helix-turn-helix transcriptional regulator [Acidimicrobiales bacterium]|jgi:transcriptional regulator with XRE-family HTH domain